MNLNQKLISSLVKPAVAGGISYLSSMVFNSDIIDEVRLPLVGNQISFHSYMGLLGAGSSAIAENLKVWVLPMAGSDASNVVGLFVGPAISVGSNMALTQVIYPSIVNKFGYQPLVLVGLTSQLGADYIYNNLINPYAK